MKKFIFFDKNKLILAVKNIISSILVASIGVAGSIAGSYYVTYLSVEKPKIEIERQKNEMAALKLVQEITPKVEIVCTTSHIVLNLQWRLNCKVTNVGLYKAKIVMQKVLFYKKNDPKEIEFELNDDYEIIWPSNQNEFYLMANDYGTITPTLKINTLKYPQGVDGSTLSIAAHFKYEAPEVIVKQVHQVFPGLSDFINLSSQSGVVYKTSLNQ
jgi:hypothetical protein